MVKGKKYSVAGSVGYGKKRDEDSEVEVMFAPRRSFNSIYCKTLLLCPQWSDCTRGLCSLHGIFGGLYHLPESVMDTVDYRDVTVLQLFHCREKKENPETIKISGFYKEWCRRSESNRHGLAHTPLKRARLPIPPLRHT